MLLSEREIRTLCTFNFMVFVNFINPFAFVTEAAKVGGYLDVHIFNVVELLYNIE